ncbi:MAG: hypothetical protein AB1814_18265 [Thermodesulfobacteriota bacterium]
MYKTVFILGAGASADAGIPVMKDFLDRARDFYTTDWLTKEEKQIFSRVFDAINQLTGTSFYSYIDLNNIENVLSAFDMGSLIGRLGNIPVEKIIDLKKYAQKLIGITIDLSTNFRQREDNGTVVEGHYHRLATVILDILAKQKDQEVSIITFNYDLALEYAMHFHKIKTNYYLNNITDDSSLPLLKLHGSVNWGYSNVDNSVIYFGIDKILNGLGFTGIKNNKKLIVWKQFENEETKNRQKIGGPVIVPPTWSKSEHHYKIDRVWKKAAEVLSKAEAIYIIGYSLPETDLFFRYLFALSTHGEVSLRRFWVFNPDPEDEVGKRFEKLVGSGLTSRYKFYKTDFRAAIDEIKSAERS